MYPLLQDCPIIRDDRLIVGSAVDIKIEPERLEDETALS